MQEITGRVNKTFISFRLSMLYFWVKVSIIKQFNLDYTVMNLGNGNIIQLIFSPPNLQKYNKNAFEEGLLVAEDNGVSIAAYLQNILPNP